jgi:hypothetical protein
MRILFASLILLLGAGSAVAQQRPLLTEDPETIGAGRVLVEGGVEYDDDAVYPVSGLRGNLWRVPVAGVSIGVSSIAEIQFDQISFSRLSITSRRPAPLSDLVTATGSTTTDADDVIVATKVRIAGETSARPAFGVRFATKLPNAGNESGLGLDTTDFLATVLAGKTTQSVRIVGNVGLGILGDPTNGHRQNDVLLYGVSFARAITNAAEVVGEVYGRANTRAAGPLPGTESRSVVRMGLRYTYGALRGDAALLLGATNNDPGVGFTAGFTYVFNAFQMP